MSLSIGIFAGVLINNNDILAEEQRKIIERLESDFEQMRKDNVFLSTQLNELKKRQELDQKFINTIIPILIKNRLQGNKVMILETGGMETDKEFINVLKAAGAEIKGIVTINKKTAIDKELIQVMSQGLFPIFAAREGTILKEIARKAAADLMNGNKTQFINLLEENNLLKVHGDLTPELDCVIAVNSFQNNANPDLVNMCLEMLQVFLNNDVKVIGTQTSQADASFINYLKERKVHAIDNIDTVMGRVALVVAVGGLNESMGQ